MNLHKDSVHEDKVSCCSDMKDMHHDKKKEPCKDCTDDCTGNCNENGCHVNVLNFQANFTPNEKVPNEIHAVSEKEIIQTSKELIAKELIFSIWHPPRDV